jgi:2-amino-4-hydroxy-6-hydroxymethyldihydropteridine diphosphokinase
MILIGIGSNLEGPWGPPHATVRARTHRPRRGAAAAAQGLARHRHGAVRAHRSARFRQRRGRDRDRSGAPALLEHLHAIERRAGRRRTLRWGPRTLDLDLLDYHGLVVPAGGGEPTAGAAPSRHPRAQLRARPIAEIAPHWRHPVLDETAADLLRRIEEPMTPTLSLSIALQDASVSMVRRGRAPHRSSAG